VTTPTDQAQPLPPGVTYATLFPRIEFPELSASPDPADLVWVEIRNPGMMPPAALEEARAGLKDVPIDAEGRPVDDDAAAPAVWAMLAKMIRRWHVYDVMADEDPMPLLPSPPRTADVVKQAPQLILHRVMETLEQLRNPR
jgi:hypothetical protein